MNSYHFGYNADMFAEAGLSAPSTWGYHWTWDDFASTGQKLVRFNSNGEVERYAAWVPHVWNRYPVWVYNAGGWLFDRLFDPKESRLNTEPVRVAMQYLHDMYNVSRIAHWDRGKAPFSSGRAAMSTSVTPADSELLKAAGSPFKMGVWYNPKLARGGNEVQLQGYGISANTEQPDAAWRWLRFLAYDMALEYMQMTGFISPLKSLGSHVANPIWLQLLAGTESYPRAVYDSTVRAALQTHVTNIVRGNVPVGTGLEQAHEQLDALLKEKKRIQVDGRWCSLLARAALATGGSSSRG